VLVNGQSYRGVLTGHGVFTMVCGSLKNPPPACLERARDDQTASSIEVISFIIFLAMILAITGLVLFMCAKKYGARNLPA
jgi:hypothetical protein